MHNSRRRRTVRETRRVQVWLTVRVERLAPVTLLERPAAVPDLALAGSAVAARPQLGHAAARVVPLVPAFRVVLRPANGRGAAVPDSLPLPFARRADAARYVLRHCVVVRPGAAVPPAPALRAAELVAGIAQRPNATLAQQGGVRQTSKQSMCSEA